MKCLACVALLVVLATGSGWAEEIKVDSRIDSVGLFKNGLAVVQRSVDVPGPGVYRLENVPTAVHGTFWIDADVAVDAQSTLRDVDSPAPAKAAVDFQKELVGKQVTIHFRDGNIPPANGIVVELAQPKGDEEWNRNYQPQNYYNYGQPMMPAGHFLVLDTKEGRIYADAGLIAFLQVNGGGETVKQRQPVLLLTVGGDKKPARPIRISYLSKGLAWAPSYRVSLTDDKTLTLEQQATIKNEMEDLKDTDLGLISGYPSIEFGHVTSPLSPSQTWVQFFNELNQPPQQARGAMANGAAIQMASNLRSLGGESADLSATPAGEGVDLHYQTLGKRTLAEGDALLLPVAHATAAYERIVEWIVPDTRGADGQFINEYQRQQEPDKYEDAAWDAVRFKNPLPFAMTTGPAMIVDGGHFAGQRMSWWVNTGEQTTLQITKALSLRTRATENEDPGVRQEVWMGGVHCRRCSVSGELTVSNHRAQDINLVIRRQFSGELGKADGDPKVVLREEGVYSINRRNELTWTLSLKSGEEKMLTYQYTVLVRE